MLIPVDTAQPVLRPLKVFSVLRGVNHPRKPVEQFAQKVCELFGQNPLHGESKIIAAARSIAEALKSLPIEDPRDVRICRHSVRWLGSTRTRKRN